MYKEDLYDLIYFPLTHLETCNGEISKVTTRASVDFIYVSQTSGSISVSRSANLHIVRLFSPLSVKRANFHNSGFHLSGPAVHALSLVVWNEVDRLTWLTDSKPWLWHSLETNSLAKLHCANSAGYSAWEEGNAVCTVNFLPSAEPKMIQTSFFVSYNGIDKMFWVLKCIFQEILWFY